MAVNDTRKPLRTASLDDFFAPEVHVHVHERCAVHALIPGWPLRRVWSAMLHATPQHHDSLERFGTDLMLIF